MSNNPDGVKLDLRGEDLSGMDLSYANFCYSNLTYTKFSWANLHGTDLSGANLKGADLRGANLKGANLRLADLGGADLRWANTINTVGLDVICVQINISDKNRQIQYCVQLEKVTAGCFSGTLDDLRKAVDEKHDKDSVIYKRYQIALKTIEDILETY